jgi:carbohydrate binding protein with CBM4/9 domain/glycosyl hydrolase family 26
MTGISRRRVSTVVLSAAIASTAVTPAFAATPGAATPTPKNVTVANAGFESAPAWSASRTGVSLSQVPQAHTGKKALMVYAKTAGASYGSPKTPLVATTVKGAKYSLSAYVSANSAKVGAALALLESAHAKTVSSHSTSVTAASGKWTRVTVTHVASNNGDTLTARVGAAALAARAGVRVDDLSLQVTPPATPTPPPAPPAPSSHTYFGSTAQVLGGETYAQALARTTAKYGGMDLQRPYFPGMPAEWSRLTANGKGAIAVSFKGLPKDVLAGKYDAYLKNWFATAPADRDTFWSYMAEPEDDIERGMYTMAQFRDAWNHIDAIADAAHNPRMRNNLILMQWTLAAGSHRNWQNYYPGAEHVDILGWDVYNKESATGTSYAPPSQVFGRIIAISTQLNKPFAIGETGAKMAKGDNGTLRAKYLTDMGAFLRANKAVYVAYFDSTVGGDFRLLDKPSIAAWAKVMHP